MKGTNGPRTRGQNRLGQSVHGPRRGGAHLAAVCGAILVLSACASDDDHRAPGGPALVQEEFGSLDQVLRHDDLYLACEVDEDALELAARRGFRAVLDLRSEDEVDDAPFGPHARRVGLEYVHVAVDPTALDDASIDRALDVIDPRGQDDGSVLVIGGSVDSPAAVFAIHRAVIDGAGVEEALADGRAAGLKPGVSESQVKFQVERLTSSSDATAEDTSADTTDSSSSSSSDAGGNA